MRLQISRWLVAALLQHCAWTIMGFCCMVMITDATVHAVMNRVHVYKTTLLYTYMAA